MVALYVDCKELAAHMGLDAEVGFVVVVLVAPMVLAALEVYTRLVVRGPGKQPVGLHNVVVVALSVVVP